MKENPSKGESSKESDNKRSARFRARLGRLFGNDFSVRSDRSTTRPREFDPEVEITEIRQLVRDSADEVVAALPGCVGIQQRFALGYVVRALVDTEGIDSAHNYASSAIESLDMKQGDAFGVWTDLYKKGDTKAMPKARRAAAIGGETEIAFVEEIGALQLGGLYSAERLVELVEAGDLENMDIARGITKNVFVTERADLFGKLYCMGDAQSLDLAISAAHSAKEYTESTGDPHYKRSEQALSDMASSAIDRGNIDDAFKLMGEMEDNRNKALLHIQLYRRGQIESGQYVENYLRNASEYETNSVQRSFAEAGDSASLDAVRKRTKKPPKRNIQDHVADLMTLYNTGDNSASGKILKIILKQEHPEYYLYYLVRAGLKEEATVIAETSYDANPSPKNARCLLDFRYDNTLWTKVFHNYLYESDKIDFAAVEVMRLAARAKELAA